LEGCYGGKTAKLHNNLEGLGQFANHTCCDEHWNANLEVATIEHEKDTDIIPMVILRVRGDIKKDTEILTRYCNQQKDAWLNIFEYQWCACTNHTRLVMPPQTETVVTIITERLSQVSDKTFRENWDLQITTIPHHSRSQERSERVEEDYPEWEMDNMDWNELEQFPVKGAITRIIQLEETSSPLQNTPPHPRQVTRQSTFEDQLHASTNHKLGKTPNPTEATHSEPTNTTGSPMKLSGKTSWVNKDPQITTTPHHSCKEERR